jgi:hypothetical protein
MDQSVMVFGGSAARSSAIGTANFEEGMVSYLTDTDKVEAYNGTDWVSVAPTTSQGLTLINTTSFSGVSSISLPAGTFTTAYTNYRVIYQLDSTSTGTDAKIRFRTSGTDNSSNVYYSSGQFNYAYNGANFSEGTNPSTISVPVATSEDNIGCLSIIDVMNPQVAIRTFAKGLSASKFNNRHFSICHDSTTQFDSLTYILGGGTGIGKVYAYGYNA